MMITSVNTYPQIKYNQRKQVQNNVAFGESFFTKKLNEFAKKAANSENIQKFVAKTANAKPMKKIVDWATAPHDVLKNGKKLSEDNMEKLSSIFLIGYSAVLQASHIYNILRNKQIPQERKETLAVNNALAFIIPTIGALTIDKGIHKGMKTFEKYVAKTKGIKELTEHQARGIGVLRKVFIFGMMYKYFATVITTPMADVTTDWMRDKGIIGKKRNK